MSRAEIVNAVIAKHDAPAGAEPAPDASVAPPGGTSGAGSASADVEVPASGGAPASPEATTRAPDHDVLQAKLLHDRKVRQAKALKRQAREEAAAAEKARKEAEEEREKVKNMTWLDRAKADKRDPREVYEEMRQEALQAGTPEAREKALTAAFEAKLAAFETEKLSPLQKTLEEITKERDDLRRQNAEQGIQSEFQRGMNDPRFASLAEEYDPPDLFRIARGLHDNPVRLRAAAKELQVPLTGDDGSFTMLDIFNVMHATQAAHVSRRQRRTQSAAPHTSQDGQQQPPQAKPPVNGTVERNAGPPTTIGNDLATSTAANDAEREALRKMTRGQRVTYVAKKYG